MHVSYRPLTIRSSVMHTVRSEFDHINKTVAQLVHKHVHVHVDSKSRSYMYVHTCYKFSMEVNEGLLGQPYCA